MDAWRAGAPRHRMDLLDPDGQRGVADHQRRGRPGRRVVKLGPGSAQHPAGHRDGDPVGQVTDHRGQLFGSEFPGEVGRRGLQTLDLHRLHPGLSAQLEELLALAACQGLPPAGVNVIDRHHPAQTRLTDPEIRRDLRDRLITGAQLTESTNEGASQERREPSWPPDEKSGPGRFLPPEAI